jgi:RNA polymerase sigma-70 factor (ECF subfamily)
MIQIPSDEQLINQFLDGRKTDSESAFEILVQRHGPMLFGVCRRVLHREQDAEDAVQTTFLALARKAGTIRDRRMLGGWLREVAHRIALRARARASRRQAIECQTKNMPTSWHQSEVPDALLSLNDLRPVLHEEMDGLPVKYGILVVLGYMEGKSNQEVADLLKLPIGTVKGRLSRAREMLRARLSQRGLDTADVLSLRLTRRTARPQLRSVP